MNCEDYRELLTAFHDGELSASEVVLLKKHLEECESCSSELEEIRAFSREIHAATAQFREATKRIGATMRVRNSRQLVSQGPGWFQPAWLGAAAVILFLAGFLLLQSMDPNGERLASWGLQHYSLVDQTHPVRGNADSVRSWFQEHHGIAVQPPSHVNYASLTGCKMTELDSRPVPLMRFEGREVKAVFILPQNVAYQPGERVLQRDGFRIEFWKEGATAYMALSKL